MMKKSVFTEKHNELNIILSKKFGKNSNQLENMMLILSQNIFSDKISSNNAVHCGVYLDINPET